MVIDIQRQLFEVDDRISQAIRELSRLEDILDEIANQISNQIGSEMGFEFVNISLVVPEQDTIESVRGIGIAAQLVDLAKHYLEKNEQLRDIQADIVQTRRTEVISGNDKRFDRWIYNHFGHERLVRIFTPIIIVQDSLVGDEARSNTEKWLAGDPWKKIVDENRERQHTVFEMRLTQEIPDEAIKVIGTVEVGYSDPQRRITDDEVISLNKLIARRALDIRKAQLPYVLVTIAENARLILGADLTTLHFLREPHRYIYEVCTGKAEHLYLKKFPPREHGLGYQALRDKEPKFVPNSFENGNNLSVEDFNPTAGEEGTKAYAAFPLLFDSEVKVIDGINTDANDTCQECPTFEGVLYVHFQQEHKFTEEERLWGKFLAKQAITAIQKATTLKQERNRKRQIAVLQSVVEALRDLSTVQDKKDELLHQIAWRTLNILAADVVTIYEYNQPKGQFLKPMIAGWLKDENMRVTKKFDEDNAPSLLVKHGRNQYSSRISGDKIFKNSNFAEREGIKSASGVLLKVRERIIGVMFINYRRPHFFYSNERNLIETLASAAATAIETQRNLHLDSAVKVSDQVRQPKTSTARLSQVTFENIGTFNNLDLKLDANWNILLGENGVGKSTILKAIGTATVGKNIPPHTGRLSYAERLLKAGENSGSITLKTIDETGVSKDYKVELHKNNASATEIVTVDDSFLEAEGILVLEFTSLRTAIINYPIVTEETPRSTLSRFCTDGTDTLVENLKKWIIDLDSQSKDFKPTVDSERQYEKILDDFFQVIDLLVDGLRIERGHINFKTYEVTVLTDDGELPIELLSQGIISIISWVGILLQHLYKIYDRDEDPKQRYALVLIDEIDAHLHPTCQQTLIHSLSKVFPNVQFIVTTHSPLIVAGMRAEQLFRFERDAEGKATQVEIKSDMAMGRVDQVLTSKLFGLQTTVDMDTQAKIREYQELLGRRNRTEQEEKQFQEIRDILNVRIPLSYATPDEREEQAKFKAYLLQQAKAALLEAQKNNFSGV